ncbi:MAG: NAD-dependent epimerase/dehydratase family protein [Anaerolineae bacterium]|jgi:UDP-glucose 4-epimerase|nr:NAD(P)-dependent oxidoreductase [Chloroflexota bacterium]
MKVLITGGSGRLARWIVRALRADHELVLFSRTAPPEECADLPWIQGDLNVAADCERAVEGVDAIQHLGAVPSPSDHPQERANRERSGAPLPPMDATMHTNIMGTYYLLQAAVHAGVETMVMAGSNCAFGHGYRISSRPFPFSYLPLDEEHPSDVEDSYSYSKLVGEELLASFTRAYGIRTYVTRPAGICPPERLQQMAANAAPARAWSDWLWGYVPSEDLAEMHKILMERAQSLPEHRVYVANGRDSTALEPTLELIERYRADLLPLAGGLSGHQAFFSTERARRELDWEPRHSWRDYL